MISIFKFILHKYISTFVLSLVILAGCSTEEGGGGGGEDAEDTSPIENIPTSGVYFEVYASTTITNDITYSVTDKSFIGTSNSGMTFDVTGYNTYIVYVPSAADTVQLDAIQLNNITDQATTDLPDINIGDNVWIQSHYGVTHTHVTSNFNPFYSTDPNCIEFSSTCLITSVSGTVSRPGQYFIEGPNDGLYIKNIDPNKPAYYISNTLGASSITVFLVD